VTLKVADDFPAITLTEAGSVAADALELFSVTVNPPDGAEPVKVTVPVTAVVELP
jgi:hypothetical protein